MNHNNIKMEDIIKHIDTTDLGKTKTTYECKKCDKIFKDLSAIKVHLHSKKSCDQEKQIINLINEWNISNTNFKCKYCDYETTVRHTFYKHIIRKQSCKIEEKQINGKIIIEKDNKFYVLSTDKKRNMRICDECIKMNKINYVKGKGNFCLEHGGEKYIPNNCIKCEKKATHQGYCLDHYKLLNKEDKILQCENCKNIFSDKRALDNHMNKINCLEHNNNKIFDENKTKYQCEKCNKIFEDKYSFTRHINTKKSCSKEKNIKENIIDNKFTDEEGRIRYQCLKCDKIFRDRYGYTKHANGPRNCNPNYEIKIINNKTIIFKNNNKYLITYCNGNKNENLICKEFNCYLCAVSEGYCSQHGGTSKKYYCQFNDVEDGKCDKLYKVMIDGIRYCIFHGGCPKLKKCENNNCNKLIHSATFCTKHKLNIRIRNKENDKITRLKYRRNNLDKKFINDMKSSDKKVNRNINHKDYITEAYIRTIIEISNYQCHWCKRNIHTNIGNYNPDQISLDRKDNSLPHLINNIVVSCLFCNRARNSSTLENWEEYISILYGNEKTDFLDQEYDNYWACTIIGNLKRFDKENNRENDLTTEWLKEQFEKNKYSHHTGIEMFPSKTPYYSFQPSLDRIDNTKGHTKDNVVLCCIAENFGRNNMLYQEFKDWLNKNFPIE